MTKPLRTQGLADVLGVHKRTIDNWRKKGKIPYMKPSRTVFYDLDTVLKAISHEEVTE
jgi:excisionase family DNA binding protein